MWLLHAGAGVLGDRHAGGGAGGLAESRDSGYRGGNGGVRDQSHRRGDPRTDEREHLSLRGLSQYRGGHSRRHPGRWVVRPFTYERAVDPRLAVIAAGHAGAKFISGGTNLLDLMKLEIE